MIKKLARIENVNCDTFGVVNDTHHIKVIDARINTRKEQLVLILIWTQSWKSSRKIYHLRNMIMNYLN